jgi:hypothetical protein
MINIELGGVADRVPATLNPRSGRCEYCVGLRVSSYWVSQNSQRLQNHGGLSIVTPHYSADTRIVGVRQHPTLNLVVLVSPTGTGLCPS